MSWVGYYYSQYPNASVKKIIRKRRSLVKHGINMLLLYTRDGITSSSGDFIEWEDFKPSKIYPIIEPRLTDGISNRWSKNTFVLLINITNNAPFAVSSFWRDNLNHMLKVCYKSDTCFNCSDIVHGDHFRGDCLRFRQLIGDPPDCTTWNMRFVMYNHILWYRHVAIKHKHSQKWITDKVKKSYKMDILSKKLISLDM